MKCPYCHSQETKVVDKRDDEASSLTRRRRECIKCEKRFTTYETVQDLDITIIKKDGSKEPFSKEKLKLGIVKACEKRPLTEEKIEQVVQAIEANIRKRSATEIPSSSIGDLVMRKLKSVDQVAYMRFASVYREFEDLDSFKKELRVLTKR